MYQKRYETTLVSLLIMLICCGCDPNTIYRSQNMSLDLNGCIDSAQCEQNILNRTALGCYVTQEQNDSAEIRRNRFQVGADGTLIFADDSLEQSIGDRFIGSMFFLSNPEQACDNIVPNSSCGPGCLLRLRHEEVTVGNQLTKIRFSDGVSCDFLSEDENVLEACIVPVNEDMGGMELIDIGGMEVTDIGGMDMGDVDMLVGCDPNLVNTECMGEGIGACGQGIIQCVDDELICITAEESLERCDAVDNDCDGNIDEGLGGDICRVGVGACETTGVLACIGGMFSCAAPEVPTPASDDQSCDGIDDDCDGSIDENYFVTVTTCGLGACAAMGTLSCVGGVPIDSCVTQEPGNPQADLCDLVDSDCDGFVDEAFEVSNTQCGVGACASTGMESCQNGVIIDSCVQGQPILGDLDQSCDLIDNDCDGRVDEAYQEVLTTCGFGVCASTGQRRCNNGVEVDSCMTLPETDPNDLACDGLDGDCDNSIDEGYSPVVSTCGGGVCQRFGVVSCIAGALSDDCSPGVRTRRDDPTCNGLDEDCDGLSDEDFTPYASPPCGEGICQQQGQFICQAGVLTDTCTPLSPQTNLDGNCNNVDEDCDGQSDEDYPVSPTSCGIGECASTGELRCDNGIFVNTCEPITFTGAINDGCDGLDNDCDTRVDEDFVTQVVACDVGSTCVTSALSTCINNQLGDSCDEPANRDSDGDGIGDPCAWISAPGLTLDILRHEVTFGSYRDCVAAGGCNLNPINYNVVDETNDQLGCQYLSEDQLSSEPLTHPLRCTNNNQLAEYCAWIGGRLPTLDELQDQIQPTFGPFDCSNSNGGDCPGASGLPKRVCSLEANPGDSEICDLGGNVYETTSDFLTRANGSRLIYVCFDDFTGSNAIINSCATQVDNRMGPRIGGRCVRD